MNLIKNMLAWFNGTEEMDKLAEQLNIDRSVIRDIWESSGASYANIYLALARLQRAGNHLSVIEAIDAAIADTKGMTDAECAAYLKSKSGRDGWLLFNFLRDRQ